MAGVASSVAKILGARKKFDATKHTRGAGGKFSFQGGRKHGPGKIAAVGAEKVSAKSTVYGLADKMSGASKKDVLSAATAAGVNPSTAANHYFYWQKAQAEKALKKLGPDPVAAIAKAPDPMQKLRETVGKSLGLKAPAKTPEPKPEPKADPAPKKTEESSGPKLKPEADAALKKLQGLRDKHQAALDKAEVGSDLHKKSANNVKYYNSKIKSHKADPDNHAGVQKPADAPEVKKVKAPKPVPKVEPKVEKAPIHPDYQKQYDYHTWDAKYYEGKVAGATKVSDKKHYQKQLDVAKGKLKELEAKSAAKGAAPPPEPKVQVHPSLQQSYDHYASQKKHLDSMDTSKMSTYQKTNHNIQKEQVEEQLKGLTKDSDKLMGKPVKDMTDAELAKTVEALKAVAPVKKVDGQHSFDSWKDVNGVHFMGGSAGLSYMKPVRDKAGVDFNNTSPAVQSYTGNGYDNINGGLRGKETLTAKSKSEIKELDTLISKSTFKEDTVMWRGVGGGSSGLTFNGSPPPDELVDNGFTSVSFNPGVARGFSDRKTLFRVRIPKGFPGLNMGIGSPATSDEGLQSEAEVLLPRGTTYRVVARHAEAGPKGLNGKPNMDVVDLEPVLPPGYPKYD